ncbi:hypothetical protein GQ44DRAFT_732380 [Phaeosphaeriaceae sp. PMI808]|nr:hypothetical protein GQ44DRAFT_732380 [Phaeosphaeriaceae sp. PMI808]
MPGAGVEKRGCAATVRACDLCRKRKRRCLWNSGIEGCTNCVNLKETCTTTHVRKPRAKPQRGNRIAEYETRIQTLEALIQERSAAQPQIEQQPLQPADNSVPTIEWVANLRNQLTSIPRPNVQDFEALYSEANTEDIGLPAEEISGELLSPTPGNDTDVLAPHLLASSPVENIQMSPSLLEDAIFLQNIDIDREPVFEEDSWIPPPIATQPSCDLYLPPPELGTALLSEYLVDCNTASPLYRPHMLANHLRICYSGQSDGSTVSWVTAYIVFGMAHMARAMSTVATTQDNELAKYYLGRIYNSLDSLLLSPPSLGLVQCLIGVATLCRCTPCSRSAPDGHFCSTSVRVAQSLATPDEGTDISDTERDVEQERRVLWLAFINDTNVSMLSNTPATQRREDIVAPCPEENPADSLGTVIAAEGHWKANIFYLRVNLALLQAEAIEQVLSAKARSLASTDRNAAAEILVARLREFHNHELFRFSPAQLFQLLYRSDIAHTVSIESAYFATVFRLNAVLALEKNSRVNPFSPDGLRLIALVKEQRSYPEAKRLLSLLPIAPRGDVGLYWQVHYMLIAALVTVLAHHVNNPEEARPTRDEIRVCNQLIIDLGTMAEQSVDIGDPDIGQARELCMSLFTALESGLRIQWLQSIAERDHEITQASLRA